MIYWRTIEHEDQPNRDLSSACAVVVASCVDWNDLVVHRSPFPYRRHSIVAGKSFVVNDRCHGESNDGIDWSARLHVEMAVVQEWV